MAHREIKPAQVYKNPNAPFSLATCATGTRLLQLSGQVAQDAKGHNVGKGDIEKQTVQVLDNLQAIVETAGGSLADICRLVIYLTSREHLGKVMEVRNRYFKPPYPAATAIVVAGLANPEWLVEIEATGVMS